MPDDSASTPPPGRLWDPDHLDRQLRYARRRAHRHWLADGLVELLLGGVFGILAPYFLVQARLESAMPPPGTAAVVAFNLLLPAVIVLAAVLGRRAIRAAKERVVVPRAGFVSYRPRREPRWLRGVGAAAAAMVASIVVRRIPGVEPWLPAILGTVAAAGLAALGHWAAVGRLHIAAAVALAAGLFNAIFRVPEPMAMALFSGALGATLLLSGGLAFRRFVAEAPAAGER
jgi:hypothetical protein